MTNLSIIAFIQNMHPMSLVLILVVLLLLFGSSKLPGLARSLGQSMSEFKRGKEEGKKALDELKSDVAAKEESAAKEEPAVQEKKEDKEQVS